MKPDPLQQANSPQWWNETWARRTANPDNKIHQSARCPLIASMIPQNVSILDVASGPGAIAPLLHPSIRYVRLDHSIPALRYPGGPAILADVRHLPIKLMSFHTALATEILEHLREPHLLLRALAAIATHQIIVSVPNNRLKPPAYKWHAQAWTRDTFAAFIARTLPTTSTHVHVQPLNLIARITL